MLTLSTKISYTLLVLLLCLGPPQLFADESLSGDDKDELDQLMMLLDKHTEIATETRMNADYIPGMVTVLQGEELEARGVRSLAEALILVPGIDVSINNGGTPSLVSRGIGSAYAASTNMILINGTPMNNAFTGSGSGVATVPIEQVERIEVIRGPGGAINGEFAYSGIINIIIRETGNRLFASAGRYDTYQGGGLFSWQDAQETTLLSINLAGSKTDGADHYVGPDAFGHYGTANEARQALTGFTTLKYHDFTLLGHIIDGGQGEFFGVMPVGNMPIHQNEITISQQYKTIEARQLLHLNPELDLHVKAGWQEYLLEQDPTYMLPSGYNNPALNGGSAYSNGVAIAMLTREQKYFVNADTTWQGWQDHTLLVGLSYNYYKMKDLWLETNVDLTTTTPPFFSATPWQRYTGANNLIVPEDAHRHLVSFSLQDEYSITDTIHLTSGLRFDQYSDVGESITPRIAGVWNPIEHHIFKAQYARAFRPPTFMELYGNNNLISGNKDITPEKVDTFEIGYIFRNERRTGKATIFYSDHYDLITLRPTGNTFAYTNSGGAIQQGIEFELKEQLTRTLLFDGNLSYVDTEDKDTNTDITGARNWLANASLIYQPFSWTSMSAQYRYVGEQYRHPNDNREDLKSYNVVDLTVSLFPTPMPGLTMRVGVSNVFAEDVRCASSARSTYDSFQGYPDDLPTQDRFCWLQCSYEF